MKRRRFIQVIAGAIASLFLPKVDRTIVQAEPDDTIEVDWQIMGESIQITGVNDPRYEDHAKVLNEVLRLEREKINRTMGIPFKWMK